MLRTILVLVGLAVVVVACGSDESQIAFNEVPETGDAVRGEDLFDRSVNGSTTCSSCHMFDDDQGSPNLEGYGSAADTRVEGMSGREYSFWAIAEPGRHIISGYGNAMPNDYDEKLSPQDIADLIAYLLTL